jgi:hypothetical protein
MQELPPFRHLVGAIIEIQSRDRIIEMHVTRAKGADLSGGAGGGSVGYGGSSGPRRGLHLRGIIKVAVVSAQDGVVRYQGERLRGAFDPISEDDETGEHDVRFDCVMEGQDFWS